MRIFHNPRDRKSLESNEQKALKAATKPVKHERMEPQSTRSGATENEQAKEEEKVETTSQKAGKKKADTPV